MPFTPRADEPASAPAPAPATTPGPGAGPGAPLRLLFLDDDPTRALVFLGEHPDAVWVQTAAECIARLAEAWDEVHLDHDLGGEQFVDHNREDCGMAVVRWISAEDRPHLRRARFTIHSHNSGAATLMGMQMVINGYHVEVRPFGAPPEPPEAEAGTSAPAEPPRPETSPGPWPPFAALSRFLRNLLGRDPGPGPDAYGGAGYRRDGPPDPDAPPPERPDFSWSLPARPAGRADDEPRRGRGRNTD